MLSNSRPLCTSAVAYHTILAQSLQFFITSVYSSRSSVHIYYFRFFFNQPRSRRVGPCPRISLPKKSLGTAGARLLQAGCPSRHPTNSVQALKEFTVLISTIHYIVCINFTFFSLSSYSLSYLPLFPIKSSKPNR